MKSFYTLVCACLVTISLWSQTDGSQPITSSNTLQNEGFTIQVGSPFLGQNLGEPERVTNPIDIRFPWDVLYLENTFSEDQFSVSKGYFGNRILVSWVLNGNLNLVTNIRILRREFNDENPQPYQIIANAAPNANEYEDQFVEGGVLYEYRLEAEGVSTIERPFLTFIEGVGFRSPTAIVTGSVTFEGGNPVQDVIIQATSQGNITASGSALRIKDNHKLAITGITGAPTTAMTLQAWVKPVVDLIPGSDPTISLFEIQASDELPDVNNPKLITYEVLSNTNQLRVGIDGSEIILENHFPSGEVNAQGEDVLIPIIEANNQFVHVSALLSDGQIPTLFINGREINEDFKTLVVENYPDFDLTLNTQPTVLSLNGNTTSWNNIFVGGQQESFVDEIRVWNSLLEAETIRTDYRRFISGNNANLKVYLNANENVGRFAYDQSRTGFTFNENDGALYTSSTPVADRVTFTNEIDEIPTSNQLGILGVTDQNGNYEINAIPYSGTGESFTITPILGLHEFEPSQQLVFLGQGSEVVNGVNFTDISSFSFKGRVLYDSRGTFPSFVEVNSTDPEIPDFTGLTDGDEYVSGPGIIEEGYNQFRKGNDFFSKGEYWYNDAGTPNDTTDDYLERYARIPSTGVNIYIDGEIVLDANNFPVETDIDGFFDVQVPIGNHVITLGKNGHVFTFNSRFPAAPGTVSEFFEDANNVVTFIDETKVTVVGRVVGGAVQADKPIGFGANGSFEVGIPNPDGTTTQFPISSNNNIGLANITFGYTPASGSVTDFTRFNFSTNEDTGEYRVNILPLNYSIDQTNGLQVPTNAAIDLLTANEAVNISEIVEVTVPQYDLGNGVSGTGEPYHYERSFTYRSIPVLQVEQQTSEDELMLNETTTVSTEGFEFPVYKQFGTYYIRLNRFERYTNFDESPAIEDLVSVTDGELVITNNLALENSESTTVNPNDASILDYEFKGGIPSISPPFVRTIDLIYRLNGVDYPVENFNPEGIIIGGASDGSLTFTTAAPDVPDIILRDPPGSGSSASIESGQSISFTNSSSFASGTEMNQSVQLLTGVSLVTGGGLAGPVIDTQSINEGEIGVGLQVSSTNGISTTTTYSFSQTISTSSDPDFVGSDGDLYIGNSKNYFYGSFNDVQATMSQIGNSPSILLTNTAGEEVFISTQKSLYFVEEPSETFFVFSQKQILETIIPDLIEIVEGIDNGTVIPNENGVQSRAFYVQQINLWRKTILENERSKYRALVETSQLNAEALGFVQQYINDITAAIATIVNTFDPPIDDLNNLPILQSNLGDAEAVAQLINDNFSENISFDAGVGEITRVLTTSLVSEMTFEFTAELEESVAVQLGLVSNGVGLVSKTSGKFSQGINIANTSEQETTTTISYTLADNDPDNALSVDVVNLFDGNGPVFATIGGSTSCPYEGPETTVFFNPNTYDPATTEINPLAEDQQVLLGNATQRIENPMISATVANVSNIPETENAEFELILENNSATETDGTFLLRIDNTTNPFNAIINIDPNGTLVEVPHGEQIIYNLTLAKSISDQNDYEDIRIVLESTCDADNTFDDVILSASFVPSCSNVVISEPLDNWVYNIDTAFNQDGTTNPLGITMQEYNLGFNSFEKIDLEYRIATAPTWTRLQTYYTTQAFFDTAVANGETEITLIDGATSSFNFDIASLGLQNGNYEVRARTSCTNGTENISEIISGTVDLEAPRRFNTPSPTDGILNAGEDIKVSFNEDIFYNTAVSLVEIKGRTNQLPINNQVSLFFSDPDDTATIQNPPIQTGDISLEFWMKNETPGPDGLILSQEQGLRIELINENIEFTLGDVTIIGAIANDDLFHHYTFTFDEENGILRMYEDDLIIDEEINTGNLQFTNTNDLVFGGGTFEGNIHDFRLWDTFLTLPDAFANIYTDYIGNELNLVGYWPMNEGRGVIANDASRGNNMLVNTGWDIKPKGNSYRFENDQYLTLDNVSFAQLTNTMDATLSFWVKTGASQDATLFSNGRGDGTDIDMANGFDNKWAINIDLTGNLSLESEGISYPLTTDSVADDNWHHVVLSLNRIGALNTYLDGAQVSSNPVSDIQGFSGSNIWLGARGFEDVLGNIIVDNQFEGNLDEVRLWNTLRNITQIERDQFNEVDTQSTGILVYARLNEPDPITGDGPQYYHAFANQTVIPSNAIISSGAVNYSVDTPPIKPEREIISFQVDRVINGDEMILNPVITSDASIEGQILDITVHRMFDATNNIQESPITWTAFVNKNPVRWFVEGFPTTIDIVKQEDEDVSFNITLENTGGSNEPFSITNVPAWLQLETTSGTLAPDSTIEISATISNNISSGDYEEDIFLVTDFGFDQKLQINLRVLTEEPDWSVDPSQFDFSMNILGRIRIDGAFSSDAFDNLGVFVNGEPRGVADLIYDTNYQQYFAFLTVYSNENFGEELTFRIWDASQGAVLNASIDGDSFITFQENEVLGSLIDPVIFDNSGGVFQELVFNQGWTWISMGVNDINFTDLNTLTQGMTLATEDRILSHAPSQLEIYYVDSSIPENSGWSGTISSQGGLSNDKMYRVYLDTPQQLAINGPQIDLNSWSFPIQSNWNWLPFPLLSNQPINEALALFNAQEGDVIKSQTQFAIYDPLNGWIGTLTTLKEGNGYMLRATNPQEFSYPAFLVNDGILPNTNEETISNFANYENNMNMVLELPEGYDRVNAYNSHGELIGKSKNQLVNTKELAFITLYGNVSETITFEVSNSQNTTRSTTHTTYTSNAIQGDIRTPVQLLLGKTDFRVFPNPFENQLVLEMEFIEDQDVEVAIYNVYNQRIYSSQFSSEKGKSTRVLDLDVAAGVYFVHLITNEETTIKKVIKK